MMPMPTMITIWKCDACVKGPYGSCCTIIVESKDPTHPDPLRQCHYENPKYDFKEVFHGYSDTDSPARAVFPGLF